ncbi:molybdenum cofactor guanylyltransferase [Oleiagrimonas soli]|uniref:Molybdopterin-guanine dinucleotide biosynthesis protein A n=1 Tax=Oleiagrimonas soli TaxID=1543381 RepID=A0A841KG91_9GAMM|nr:molybdenum cofactor guanylyltransferase [Oleiagrimonas soli]MBB6184643.1 molybdopterin-guanine dinucleotide biosynthesis protein A [Oleiagrimonas soli]
MSDAGTPCIGVVLAGGRSSRMGRDKALLHWQGRPLLEHQCATLLAAGVDDVRISGARAHPLAIPDRHPQRGPLGGLSSVVDALGDVALLIVPVDMPRLTPALLARLRTAEACAACVHFADHVLPMRLRVDAETRAALDALMAADDDRARSLRALRQRVGAHALPLSAAETAQLRDCNTQADWDEVQP